MEPEMEGSLKEEFSLVVDMDTVLGLLPVVNERKEDILGNKLRLVRAVGRFDMEEEVEVAAEVVVLLLMQLVGSDLIKSLSDETVESSESTSTILVVVNGVRT
jgi:hypothetical protein